MNEKSREKRFLGEILKHPLANVVIGFLLTGVLGTSITQYYLALREKQKAQHELTVARKESIATLSTLNAEYLARAGRILAAVERGDKDSARELKTIFDKITIEQGEVTTVEDPETNVTTLKSESSIEITLEVFNELKSKVKEIRSSYIS